MRAKTAKNLVTSRSRYIATVSKPLIPLLLVYYPLIHVAVDDDQLTSVLYILIRLSS